MRVEAGKHWAEIKDADDLVAADQDMIEDALGLHAELDSAGQVDRAAILRSVELGYPMVHRLRDATWAALITAWSLDLPLPREDIESCKQVPLTLKQAIEVATEEHSALLNRHPDPKGARSATTRSSNGSSRAAHPRRTG